MIQPLWRTVWRFPKKLKIELPYDPAIPLLGIYPRDTTSLPLGWLKSNRQIITNVNKDMGKLEPSYTAGGGM